MKSKTFRSSFVVTVAGSVAGLACGGGCSSPTSGTEGNGGAGGSGGTTVCPTKAESAISANGSFCAVPLECRYTASCASGMRELIVKCDPQGGFWRVDEPCGLEWDHCAAVGPAIDISCEAGGWSLTGAGGNPPAPCPAARPPAGATCRAGAAFGRDREHCGYPCDSDSGSGWTIVSCINEDGPSEWKSDGVCQ